MNSKFKAFGLALTTALALSAVVAAISAQAEPNPHFRAITDGPATVSATGTEKEVFTAFGSEFFCEHAEFTGGEIPKGGTTVISVTPVYSKCSAKGPFGTLPTTVTHNGCKFTIYHPTTEEVGGSTTSADGKTHYYKATVSIHCAKGKAIEVHIYASHTAHTEGKSLCTITIAGETDETNIGLEGLTLDSTTLTPEKPDVVDLTGKVTKIHAEMHRNSFLCPSSGSTPTDIEASYQLPAAGLTATGKNAEGKATSIYIK